MRELWPWTALLRQRVHVGDLQSGPLRDLWKRVSVVPTLSGELVPLCDGAIGVNYAFNEDLMVYAKYVTGFKAGGFNDLASRVDLIPFDSEIMADVV